MVVVLVVLVVLVEGSRREEGEGRSGRGEVVSARQGHCLFVDGEADFDEAVVEVEYEVWREQEFLLGIQNEHDRAIDDSERIIGTNNRSILRILHQAVWGCWAFCG